MVWRLIGAKPLSEPMLAYINWTLGTNRRELLIRIQTFSFNNMCLKMSSTKWRPFSLGLNIEAKTKWHFVVNFLGWNLLYSNDGLLHWRIDPWWRHQMETFSAPRAICAGNSPVPGEFPAQRPVTRSFDVFFDLRLNKRLSKQSWGWWFETLSRPLWRHCNAICANRSRCMG